MKLSNPNIPASISERTIPIIEEQVQITKVKETQGTVRVQKSVEQLPFQEIVELNREEITVERIPVNREISSIPEIQYDDDVTIIPVVREVPVVVKKLMLVEEVHIRKITTTETTPTVGSVRAERISIERIPTKD